uniref:DUF6598 domain-containing protein n=1 Tax=Triticum urartu TaxID=4572 RepID=A0A8R7PXW1_TRIUA
MNRLSRPLVSFMASAPPRWWPPALARRLSPPSERLNPTVRRASRFPLGFRNMATGIRSSEVDGHDSAKPDTRLLTTSAHEHSAITQGMNNMSRTKEFISCYGEIIDGKRDAWGKTVGCGEEIVVSDDEEYESWDALMARYPFEGVLPLDVFPKSRHRDGSIYKCTHPWTRKCLITDRSETVFEAMMFTEPSNCFILNGTCMRHAPSHMFQILSIKLAKLDVDGGPVALYGYIAVRDDLDPLLNYIIKYSRDDPIIVEQGSLFNLAGPKRGIDFYGNILIEYDMRIRTAKEEKDDLQLIDGASMIGDMGLRNCHAFTNRIHGDSGAVDVTFSRLENAVEATVEVFISEVQNSFSLFLGCLTSGLSEEIRLFDGVIGETQSLKRSVVAVVTGSSIHLKFKVGLESSSSAEHDCSFIAGNHGSNARKIETDFALISVKVTWSPLPKGH